jgi:hypothetical protein
MAVENTTCVQPADYEAPNFTAETIVVVASVVAAIFSGGIALLALAPTALSVMRKVLEYLLHGKLVCLGGDQCAIGYIAELEPVGYQKPFPTDIDDDYSFNLVLAGSSLSTFERDSKNADQAKHDNLTAGQTGPQGALITEQAGMPEPREAKDGFGHYEGYYVWFEGPSYGKRFIMGDKQLHVPIPNKSPTGPFPVPVLHAECEGNRPADLLGVLDNIPPGLGGVCKIPIIGKIACAIVSTLLLPFVLAGLVIAWFASDHGDPADAGAGTIEVGELVVVNGRWSYDAGHTGYNEIHPVRTIQKIPNESTSTDFETWRKTWCRLSGEAPPVPETPGTKPAGMTPAQGTIWEAQQDPENTWELHPDVDGCLPVAAPEPPHGEVPPLH